MKPTGVNDIRYLNYLKLQRDRQRACNFDWIYYKMPKCKNVNINIGSQTKVMLKVFWFCEQTRKNKTAKRKFGEKASNLIIFVRASSFASVWSVGKIRNEIKL